MTSTARIDGGPFVVTAPAAPVLRIVPGVRLGPGDLVEVQFPNSWLMLGGPSFTRALQTTDPGAAHHVSVRAPGVIFSVAITPRHLNYPEGVTRHGRLISARIESGSVPPGGEVTVRYANTVAPVVAEHETVWVRLKGRLVDPRPEIVTLADRGATLRLVAPSGVEPGEPFELLVVSLDRLENLSSQRFDNRTVSLAGGPVVASGVSFTGAIRVPVRIDEPGVWRLEMDGTRSNAVRVERGRRGPFWGDIHIHTRLSHDGLGADPYGYARDVAGLDFAAAIDHADSLGPAGYEQLLAWAREATAPERFAALLGDERNPPDWTGHHNIYFRDEAAFRDCALRPGQSPAASMAAVRGAAGRALVVPHHTGNSWMSLPPTGKPGNAVVLEAIPDDGGMRPIMEIYSHHGQSELYDPGHVLSYELNRMRNPELRSNTSTPGAHYARDWWSGGRRMGVIGSSDEHTGRGGRPNGGIAAVFAESLMPESVFDALAERRCYATTGERILLDFSVDGVDMGREARRPRGATLTVRLDVRGTTGLIRVEILRFRRGIDAGFLPVHADSPRGEVVGGVPQLVTDRVAELRDELAADTVYYARVVQMPVERPGMAWSSPVWIDLADRPSPP